LGQDETGCQIFIEEKKHVPPHKTPPQLTYTAPFTPYIAPRRPSYATYTPTTTVTPQTPTKTTTPSTPTSRPATLATAPVPLTGATLGSPTDPGAKRLQKPYGRKDTGSPGRSRSATKELELPPDDTTMFAPDFSEKLSDLVIKDGDPLQLRCAVTGDPDPQVEWFKNGVLLRSSDIIDLKYKKGIATLSINEVFPEDEGEYVCKATNSEGTTETKCKLTVEPMEHEAQAAKATSSEKPPRILDHLQSLTVNDGEAVTLSCRIVCSAKFDVVWLRNEKEIKSSSDFLYENDGDIHKLVIAEIFPEDGGTYTCEAFNDAGEAFSSCTLVVVVPTEEAKGPKFTTFPKSLTIPEGKAAVFNADFDKSPNKVSWLKDGKPLDESSGRHLLTLDKKQSKLEIPNALVTDVGQYSVKAADKKGVEITATFALNVFTEDDI
jgi:hypothetical protein